MWRMQKGHSTKKVGKDTQHKKSSYEKLQHKILLAAGSCTRKHHFQLRSEVAAHFDMICEFDI